MEPGQLSEQEIAERAARVRRQKAAGMTVGEMMVEGYADDPHTEQEWCELAKEMGKSNTEGDYPPQ